MGKLIVIEGMDGSGKSTQTKRLTTYFQKNNYRIKSFHFPTTDGFYGRLISSFLKGELGSVEEVDPYFISSLYAFDRKEMADEIRSWIKEYDIVLFDRYAFSNVAYQCAKVTQEEEKRRLKEWILNFEFEINSIPVPDINLFLGVPISFVKQQLGKKRKGQERDYLEGKKDIHEKDIGLQQKVEKEYLALCQEEKVVYVNCGDGRGNMKNSEDIYGEILQMLAERKILRNG